MSDECNKNIESNYFEHVRYELLESLPHNLDKVLEIGCGKGRTLAWIKEQMACKWVAGVEINQKAAADSSKCVDDLYIGDIETLELPISENSLDAILCPDVLEHLVDPWSTLKRLKKYLKPNGILIVSIPNVRNYRVVLPLLFLGKWDYQESGILDRTHLRFFVKETALNLVKDSGFKVVSVKANGREKGSKSRILDLLSLGLFRKLFDFQYIIVARKY